MVENLVKRQETAKGENMTFVNGAGPKTDGPKDSMDKLRQEYKTAISDNSLSYDEKVALYNSFKSAQKDILILGGVEVAHPAAEDVPDSHRIENILGYIFGKKTNIDTSQNPVLLMITPIKEKTGNLISKISQMFN